MNPKTFTRGLALLCLALLIHPATPPRAALAGDTASRDAAPSFAIRAKRIFTMAGPGGRGVIEGGTLVVIDGKVAAVGTDVKVPAGIPVHEHPNAVLVPGLVDASSRLAGARRGNHSVGAQYLALDGFDSYANHAEALSEGVTTVYLTPGWNRLLAGQGSVVKLSGGDVLRERADLMVVLGEAAFATPDLQKAPFPSSEDVPIVPGKVQGPKSRLSQFAELETKFRKAAAYAKARGAAAGDRPEYDAALAALAAALERKMPYRVDARRARDILQTLRHRSLFESGLVIHGGTEAHRVADHLKKGGVPVILEVPVRFDSPGSNRGLDPELPDESLETASALAGAGVPFAITGSMQTRSGDLMMAAMAAVRGGLPELDALVAVTRRPAEILGVAERVGSLQPGRDADFVVLSGDPMRTTTNVLCTYVSGHLAYEAGTAAGAVVVRAGTVFTASGDPIRDGAVLVEDGKIAAVGHTVPTPRGAQVIDAGPDAYVTPGFIDAHGHLGLENDQADLDPDLSLSRIVSWEKRNFHEVAASGVTTVLLAPYRPNRGGSQVLAMKTSGRSRDALVVADPAAVYFSFRGQDPLTGLDAMRAALKKGKAYDDKWKKYHEDVKKWEAEEAKKKADEAAKKKADGEKKTKEEEEEEAKPAEEDTVEEEVVEEQKADPISGTWTVTISGGPIPEPQEGSMKLKLEGTSVTGTLESMMGEANELSGTFQGNQLILELDVETPMGAPTIEAVLDREDHLKGELKIGDMFSLDFEGTRTEKEVPEIRITKKKKKKDGRPEPPPVQDSLEPYRELFAGKIAALVDVQTAAQIDGIVKVFATEFKVPLVLLNADDAARVSETIVKSEAGVVLQKQVLRRTSKGKLEVPADRLARLGIAVAFQSGAEDAARDLPHNVAYAVHYGLDATTALRGLTIDAARMFRIDDRVGSLEVGKDGDLLIFSGNPFEAASRLEHVIISGKEVQQP